MGAVGPLVRANGCRRVLRTADAVITPRTTGLIPVLDKADGVHELQEIGMLTQHGKLRDEHHLRLENLTVVFEQSRHTHCPFAIIEQHPQRNFDDG